MSPPEAAPIADMLVKVGLALLGALFGAAVSTYIARKRLRRLLPFTIRQLRDAAHACTMAYSPAEAAASSAMLEAASKLALELVAAGINLTQWQMGGQYLRDAQLAASAAATSASNDAPRTTSLLRQQGGKLRAWVESIE
jgi:hypothetical protein